MTSLSGKDKIAIQRIANTCVSYFQTCQESWHPNAAGHAVLGKCPVGRGRLAGACGDLHPPAGRHDRHQLTAPRTAAP